MIDQTDRHLADWIGETLKDVEVSLVPPAASETTKKVCLYLVELLQSPPARGIRRPPLVMTLRYLVTTHAPTPEEAHNMLGQLVVAALQNAEFEVEQDSLPVSFWTAIGLKPQPSFVLRVPFKHERPEKVAPFVKRQLVIKQLPLRVLEGQVVGPEDIPIMDARVELPALDLSTSTDARGRFRFSSIPAASGPRQLRIRAKGREFSINTEQAESGAQPLVIHLQLEG